MAASSTVSMSGTVSGGITGTKTLIAPTITNATSTDAIGAISLASGFTSVPVPANAVGAVIVPPAGNTNSITLKGVTGDTGIPLHVTNPSLISLVSGATTIGVTLGAGMVVEFWWF